MTRRLALGAALFLSACGGDADGTAAASGRDGTAQEGLDACFTGDVPEGLGLVQRRADAGEPDALTARALCRWMAFAADSVRADAQDALADYDAAIAAAETGASQTPVDGLLSQRAFARLMLDADGWEAVIEDLDAAAARAPGDARHVLDRAFVHLAAGDSAAAVQDFERVLLVDATDTTRVELAQQALGDLTGVPPEAFFRDQETVVFD